MSDLSNIAALFRAAWHVADSEGDTGNRTPCALKAALAQWGITFDESGDIEERDAFGQKVSSCPCARCSPDWWGMRICAKCGNKRCPHAADHANTCTQSNEPGQDGSLYPRTRANPGQEK